MMNETLVELSTYLKDKLGDKLEETILSFGELTIISRLDAITDVLMFVRDDSRCQFINITDISGVDYPSRDKRFDVSYQLLSPRENLRLRVKVRTDENTLLLLRVLFILGQSGMSVRRTICTGFYFRGIQI